MRSFIFLFRDDNGNNAFSKSKAIRLMTHGKRSALNIAAITMR